MVTSSLGMITVTLHFQGPLKASMIFFAIAVDPNIITSSKYTMANPRTYLRCPDTTFHTFLKVGH
eukprot:9753158-Prorocentrum_lima.AAC.1